MMMMMKMKRVKREKKTKILDCKSLNCSNFQKTRHEKTLD